MTSITLPTGVSNPYEISTTKNYANGEFSIQVQVGMSAYMVHTDENIFQDPFPFSPDRWIGKVKQLDKYLVSFSKGSRQCLGKK
jgi:hypothetical protein